MICWKDMTFCTRYRCKNKKCRRHPDKWEEWRKNYDPDKLPIAVSKFDNCEKYRGDNE